MSKGKINLNKEIIALFSGQASIITTPKLYVELTGNHSLAVVLNQCVYWSNKSALKDGWFYKDYEEWFDEIHIPERTLRRRFDKLEEKGWISTKVKKAHGINTKHILIHMDRIIEGISNILDIECPNRPICPSGSNVEQNTCTKSAPTGQVGRSESATLAVSTIYTDNFIQNTTNYCESSSSVFFSKTLDLEIIEQKLPEDTRTNKEFLQAIKNHVENHSDKQYTLQQRTLAALKLLKKLKANNFIFEAKNTDKKAAKKVTGPSDYVLYSNYHNDLKQQIALKLVPANTKLLTFEAWSAQHCQPRTNANESLAKLGLN